MVEQDLGRGIHTFTNFCLFQSGNLIGGGGGSRTRVRKYSTQASTYLARILAFAFQVSSRHDT